MFQCLSCQTIPFPQKSQKDMLYAHIVVAKPARFFDGVLENFLSPRRLRQLLAVSNWLPRLFGEFGDLCANRFGVATLEFLPNSNPEHHVLGYGYESQENVFGTDV